VLNGDTVSSQQGLCRTALSRFYQCTFISSDELGNLSKLLREVPVSLLSETTRRRLSTSFGGCEATWTLLSVTSGGTNGIMMFTVWEVGNSDSALCDIITS
jgi:hypothetical protein